MVPGGPRHHRLPVWLKVPREGPVPLEATSIYSWMPVPGAGVASGAVRPPLLIEHVPLKASPEMEYLRYMSHSGFQEQAGSRRSALLAKAATPGRPVSETADDLIPGKSLVLRGRPACAAGGVGGICCRGIRRRPATSRLTGARRPKVKYIVAVLRGVRDRTPVSGGSLSAETNRINRRVI